MNIISKLILVILFTLSFGCGKKTQEEGKPPKEVPSLTQGSHKTPNAAAGVQWTVPQRWQLLPAQQMRIATYGVPAAQGDAEDAECAVFYFGADQGGDVKSNIERWISQFENPSVSAQMSAVVNEIKMTTVGVTGSYLATGGPMMQTQGKKEDYKLSGAIIEAPEGSIFFKLTGPAKTVDAGKEEFNELLQSIQKK